MNRWDQGAIEYADIEAIKRALVGRSIIAVTADGDEYTKVVTFALDDGSALKAHATDGGCACSNGCFTVDAHERVAGTILNVELEERIQTYDGSDGEVVEPGSITDGQAMIRVFVYTELGKSTLVTSEGGDNGYYGWGFWLSVHNPEGDGA